MGAEMMLVIGGIVAVLVIAIFLARRSRRRKGRRATDQEARQAFFRAVSEKEQSESEGS